MKQRIFTLWMCMAFASLLPGSVFSQTNYYVSTTGSDANAGTSLAAPYATIAKAISKATVPGDTIFVRSGTYHMTTTVNITKPGTAAKHIVLTVYMPDMVNANSRPVFDFTGMAVSSSNRGFQLSGANYWHIYGIIIKGAGDNGMYVGGTSHTVIEFCDLTQNRDTGFQIGGSSHNDTILNCDAYANADLGPGTTTQGGNADGFDPKIDPGDTILFRGCRAWLNSDDGFDGYMRPPTGVPDNVTSFLEDCWAFDNGYYWVDGSTNSVMNGNGFKLGGSDTKNLSHNFVVVKCLAFDNKVEGFDQNSNAGDIFLYNCTGYNNTGNDYYMTSPTTIYKTGAQLVIKNCISLGAAGVSLPGASTSARTLTTATNSFKTTITDPEILSFDTTGVTGMRGLDGSLPKLKFMHLDSTAPQPYTYIDKGTVLNDVMYHDTLGVPYTRSAPDLGVYELVLAVDTSHTDTSNAVPIYTTSNGNINMSVYPNPFMSTTTIKYAIPADAKISLSVTDQQGRLISRPVVQTQRAGAYENIINGQYLPGGVYFIKLTVGDQVVSRKMVKE